MIFKHKLLCSIFVLLLLATISTPLQASPNVLQVSFFQEDIAIRQNNFVLSNFAAAIPFTAVINHHEVPNDIRMTITGPDGFQQVYDRISLGSGRFGFSGTLPARAGLYNISYSSPSTTLVLAASTPLRVGVHFRADATLSRATPRVGDTNTRMNVTIRDRGGSVANIRPVIHVEGAAISQDPVFGGNGTFTLELDQITAAGLGALRLYFDNVPVFQWDVEAAAFPSLQIIPGLLYVDRAQPFHIHARGHNAFNWDREFNLSDIHNEQIIVELSGVNIAKASITRIPLDFDSTATVHGEETYRRVVLLASDLEFDALRFTSSGTLRMRLTSEDGRYISVVDLPVQFPHGSEGILGAPPFQNFASEGELVLEFSLPNSRSVIEYTAIVHVNGQDPIELHETAPTGGILHRMLPIRYDHRGRGTIAVMVTTIDRDGEVRDWNREFNFSAPILELGHDTIFLDETQSLSILLRDADGRPISDATVIVEGMGSSTASTHGEYMFHGRWNIPGFRRVQAFGGDGALLAEYQRLLQVQAPQLLLLESDTEALFAGAQQTVHFRVYDETGRELTGARVLAFVDGGTTPVISTWNSSYRTYQVRITPQHTATFVAESSDRRRISPELILPVVMPMVHTNIVTLTNLFAQRLELEFVNPVTGQPISGTTNIRTTNLQYQERNIRNSAGGVTKVGSSVAMDVYMRILNSDLEAMISVDFIYAGRTYRDLLIIPVGEATVTITPEALERGVPQQRLSFEIRSADDTPLPDLTVTLRGAAQSATSVTSEQGRVAFNVSPTADILEYVLTLTRTDSLVQAGGRASTAEFRVPVREAGVRVPAEAPSITIQNIEASARVVHTDHPSFDLHLELRDDEGLDVLLVSGELLHLTGVSAQRRVTINLEAGDNLVLLELYSINGASTALEINIIYTPRVQEVQRIEMVIGSLVVRRGSEILPAPPIPPQLINDRTMLPFRYLCETVMGGTVHFDQDSRRIYTTVSGFDVIMQVDNLEMTVNGIVHILPVAPTIDRDFTLVPLRAMEPIVTYIGWDAEAQRVTVYQ